MSRAVATPDVPLEPGQRIPPFRARSRARADFAFDTVGGRHVVLAFLRGARTDGGAALLRGLAAHRALFDDARLSFFAVTCDPADEHDHRVRDDLPGIRYFFDPEERLGPACGVGAALARHGAFAYLLDPALRVVAGFAATSDDPDWQRLFAAAEAVPPPPPAAPLCGTAPVLVLPRVFEPALCDALIDHYHRVGGQPSGFMREVDGLTRLLHDSRHKRRQDCTIEDAALRSRCQQRIRTRLLPELRRAFHFEATRMERYIVACYDAADGGHFRPHRDNTTRGTAHRRFAVSLFLNDGDYAGGYLRFPEYGAGLYRGEAGTAVVFSCSLLHEATPVTAGRRFMFLPFLYDEAGRRIRDMNQRFLETGDAGR